MRDTVAKTSDPTPEQSAPPGAPPFSDSKRQRPNTFPPADRIRKKSDYAAVFSNSRKVVDRYFVCYLAAREHEGHRLGLAVSRKVGNAVTRNRVKRYLREYYRTHRDEWTAPVDIVVVARPPAARLDFAGCTGAMNGLLKKGGVLDG